MAKSKRTEATESPEAPKSSDADAAAGAHTGESYTVLARRYRPKQFDECIGQEHVSQSLKHAIEGGRVAHAYLFTGARGVGKTSMARIFARALNCEKGPTANPCGECDICRGIASGEDVDVLEIDGASNRGIDEVRQLRQSVHYRPSRSRYKIYIIDEVHMLTKEAFNALLKTLEEPPPHAKFLFATTEVQKIPITILSRCQRFDFAGIEMDKIEKRLTEIVEAEGMSADAEAIEIIARRAGGSMRDSQSLLDQLLAFGSDRLRAEDVHRVLGTAGDDRVLDLAAALLAGDGSRCLTLVEEAISAGIQLGEWVEQMLDYFRDLMVLSISPQSALVSMPNRHRAAMLEQSKGLSPERLLEMMDLLAACRARMRASTYGRTLLEMTLVRICRLDQFLSLDAALAAGPPATNPSAAPSGQKKTPERPADPATAIAPTQTRSFSDSQASSTPQEPVSQPPLATAPSSAPVVSHAPPAPTKPLIELNPANGLKVWSQLAGEMTDRFLGEMMRHVDRVELNGSTGLAAFIPADRQQSRTYCEARLSKIEELLAERIGRRIQVRLQESAAREDAGPSAQRASYTQGREWAVKQPLVKKAEQVLGARLLDVVSQPPPPVGNAPNLESPPE